MSCFNNPASSGIFTPCCNGNNLCKFDGNLDNVVSVPVYTQYVYDAVQFNLQGMKTVQNQTFSPAIPPGYTLGRICDIRAKAYFNPANINDPRNLTIDMDTTLSGAVFLQDSNCNPVEVVGPDGTYSQKILYSDNNCCDGDTGTQIFGTQNVSITGNVTVYLDLILCDHCNHEIRYTVCTDVPIATASNPMTLTNFFEICMPASTSNAFLPRFTELTSVACEARLATNNCGRDLNIGPEGTVSGNLIAALCVTAEKKVVAPVQMCVLSTGMAEVPTQNNSICGSFPSMFAEGITHSEEGCGCGIRNAFHPPHVKPCGCGDHHSHHVQHDDCGCEDHFPHHDECGCTDPHNRHDDCGCDSHFPHHDDCGCGETHINPRNCR